MYNIFVSTINKFETLPQDLLKKIYQNSSICYHKKNYNLIPPNTICRNFYILLEGGARSFFTGKDGSEKTRRINFENTILTVLRSFVSQTPSLEAIQLLEDSKVLAITHGLFFDMLNQYPEWERFYRKVLEDAFIFQNIKIEELALLSATERFQKLINERPEVVQRVSNKILASYLGIREETLSRLKSKR